MMKNVIIYNQLNTEYHGAKRYIDDELRNFFQCQIDPEILSTYQKYFLV